MRKSASNVTPIYARQHFRTPTLPRLNAIDLLADGKTDTETAELLRLDRNTDDHVAVVRCGVPGSHVAGVQIGREKTAMEVP
jgi:hypothetical protein